MLIVDRIEGEYAVCETANGIQSIPIALLPDGVRGGVVLVQTESGYRIDQEQTEKRRAAAAAKLRRLIQK